MIETLHKLLERLQHLSDYAETKLGVLIAFNSALTFGLFSIFKDQTINIKFAMLCIIILNLLSIFFAFSGIFAKRKNNHNSENNNEIKNYYYYKYVANLNETSFLENIKNDYALTSVNSQMEKDISNQIVVLAKITDRKFRYFNIAIGFTLASIITPLGLLIFNIYNNPDWLT